MYSVCFFVKQKTAYEMRISDWSSDVCSSDLAQLECGGFQLAHLQQVQTGDDQQYAVRAKGPRLCHLPGVDHEILAEHRQINFRPRRDQIFIRPHEPGLIGQHGKAGCATRLIGAGMGRRVEILPYQSLGRASFLHFRDQPIASFGMGTIKRCLESSEEHTSELQSLMSLSYA